VGRPSAQSGRGHQQIIVFGPRKSGVVVIRARYSIDPYHLLRVATIGKISET
jgi:hypothetical protein